MIGATRAAADDFARACLQDVPARFGLRRYGLQQLAAQLAAPELAREGRAPAIGLNVQAIAARAAFEAREAGALQRLDQVSRVPSFARTLASTLGDLRRAGLDPARLDGLGDRAADLAALAQGYERQLAAAGLADTAALLRAAARSAPGSELLPRAPLLLLDVAVPDEVTRALLAALAARAASLLATVPAGDRRTLALLERLPGARVERSAAPNGHGALTRLRRHLFTASAPPADTDAPDDGEVVFFSAPGEGRECVEIARAILQEAAAGVALDRMAVFVRAPQSYTGALETALGRAGLPAWYARGVRQPDPAGRALLALLACAAERLSARRFAEYLSLAPIPAPQAAAAAADEQPWRQPAAADDLLPAAALSEPQPQAAADSAPQSPESAAPRSSWHWRRLLDDAAVAGGLDRWSRRLDGLAQELELRRAAIAREDPASARHAAIGRDLEELEQLKQFALPLIARLAALPAGGSWGQWIEALSALSVAALREPGSVLAVLGELQPMARVGPVTLVEVRDVLSERLSALPVGSPGPRHGRVFVGRPEHARGRRFDVVFVPGLAERLFPEKHRQDPLLLDALRRTLNAAADGSPGLDLQDDRAGQERLLLQLAAGAADRRLYLSYPRLAAADARPRVPSFYALDVERALTGRVPDYRELAQRAGARVGARLDWPAPADPEDAIDATEHDLAVLRPLLRREAERSARGRARYLLRLNPGLRRTLVTRWARWKRPWSRYDGLHQVSDATRAALASYRLSSRPYSAAALQRFAACPYQFLLAAVYGLAPRPERQPLERMDPVTRGRLFHDALAELLRALRRRRLLPVTRENLALAETVLDEALQQFAEVHRERLVPAIDRVWSDEMESLRIDLKGWLETVADEGGGWLPIHEEYRFGEPGAPGDDAAAALQLDGQWRLRGVVDLIEAAADRGQPLRVTDHRTGAPRLSRRFAVAGGTVLQPLLHALAVEQALDRPVTESRLSFSTVDGNFTVYEAALGVDERRRAIEVLEIIDRAIEHGSLLPAPRPGTCGRCDFRDVCGPWETVRAQRKDPVPLGDLRALRALQ